MGGTSEPCAADDFPVTLHITTYTYSTIPRYEEHNFLLGSLSLCADY